MGSISAQEIIHKLKSLNIHLITPTLLGQILNVSNQNTLHKMLQRLERAQLLTRIDKGKYTPCETGVTEFEIAGFLNPASYISFESALSHYGILSQFPYSITSVSLGKAKTIKTSGYTFEFSHLSPKLYWGFRKENNFLIAEPEKALLDSLYLTSKGLRKLDFQELDLSKIDRSKLKGYARQIKFRPFEILLKSLKV